MPFPLFSLPMDGEVFWVSPTEMCFQGLDFTFCEAFQCLFGQAHSVKHGWSCPLAPLPPHTRHEDEVWEWSGSVEANLVAGSVLREKVGHGVKTFLEKETNPLWNGRFKFGGPVFLFSFFFSYPSAPWLGPQSWQVLQAIIKRGLLRLICAGNRGCYWVDLGPCLKNSVTFGALRLKERKKSLPDFSWKHNNTIPYINDF